MTYEWNHSTINDVCVLVTDGSHSSPKSVNDGKYMVSVKDFTDYGFDFASCRMISNDDYETLKRNGCVPQIDDILIGKDGARFFEDIIIYRQREKPALLSSIAILRCDKSKILPDFLYYVLRTPSFRQDVKDNYGSGSAIPRIILKDFKRMMVSYPSLEKQQAIISVLTAIDSKIQANTEINDNLQQQAQAIYSSMFIDNPDPAWSHGHLSDLITVKYGKDHKKLADGIYPVYGSGGIMRYVERPLYNKESVLIPRKGTLNNVMYVNQPFWSVDTMFYTEMKLPNVAKFVYHFVKAKDLASMNAGSAVPSMTTDILNAMEVVIPSASALEEFESLVAPMYEAMEANDVQSKALSQMRDTLLPKLMSGEIDVSAVQL